MKKKIIIINGTGGSGKDTFVSFACKYAVCENISSVDPIKDMAKIIGWDGGKTEKDRKFLSDLKKLVEDYNDYPFRFLCEKVEEFYKNNNTDIIFLHIREPENIEKCKNTFGKNNIITLLIKNSNVPSIESNESDRRVEEYTYDYIIYNSSSLEALDYKAENFVKQLMEA